MRPSVQIALTLACVATTLAAGIPAAVAAPLRFDDRVTLGTGYVEQEAVAVGDDGTIAASWDGPLGVWGVTRRAGGRWSEPQNLTGSDGRAPQVAVTPRGNTLIAWADFDGVVRADVAGRGQPFGAVATDIGRARLDAAAGLRVTALADGRVLILWADAPRPRRLSARTPANPGVLRLVVWTPGRGFARPRVVGASATGPAVVGAPDGTATLAWLSRGHMRVADLAGGARTPGRPRTLGAAAGPRALLSRSPDGVLSAGWVAPGGHTLMTRPLGAGAPAAARLSFPATAGPITAVQFASGSAGRMVAGVQTAITRGAKSLWTAAGSSAAGWDAPVLLGTPARFPSISTPAAGVLASGTPLLVWGAREPAHSGIADVVAASDDGDATVLDSASATFSNLDAAVAAGPNATALVWPALARTGPSGQPLTGGVTIAVGT